MGAVVNSSGSFQVKAYQGDFKTLLAWTLAKPEAAKLAGFTIRCAPNDGVTAPYYLYNLLQFETPHDHAQDDNEPARSSVNAPFHKFRWLHVPGQDHQGRDPFRGSYTYTVFPRYFDTKKHMLPLDGAAGVPVTVDVVPFTKGNLTVAFTRGYVQSQAFVRHFGPKAKFEPAKHDVVFDTTQVLGMSAEGTPYSYRDEYEWCGFTARETIFRLLDEVAAKPWSIDVFAYDLKEPDLIAAFIQLAAKGQLRLILDNAALHHNKDDSKPEDKAAAAISAGKGKGRVLRGKFGRYSHDKVFVISDGTGPLKVLTGSTNFAVTGMYVNSNHVLVYEDRDVAKYYAGVFDAAWTGEVDKTAFLATDWSTSAFKSKKAATPATEFHFSPHSKADATALLGDMAGRITAEASRQDSNKKNSVLFAVMSTGNGTGPVLPALEALHKSTNILTFGISDSPSSVSLYPVGNADGVLVTGKPKDVLLSPPFNQVPDIGLGHQVHHKFVVCSFNGDDPVVYCGSSNLALGGEEDNGDNLIAIRDADVATVFAIEATALVDHFSFLDKNSTPKGATAPPPPDASLTAAAKKAGIFLGVTDLWAKKYFDANDLHQADRLLFGA